jgi:hypothetical protein
VASDVGFNFKQDTLYFKTEKYSENNELYPSKDTAFVKSYLNGTFEGAETMVRQ